MGDQNEPVLGQGDVELKLVGGDPIVLKPTVFAVTQLSRKYGGLQSVLERIVRIDIEAIVDVILYGSGRRAHPKEISMLQERVFNTGLSDDTGGVAATCAEYIGVLTRGGKPMPKQQGELDDEDQTAGN